jgi:hypothetical protein
MPDDDLTVIRTWKRDGSRNVMTLPDAVRNLYRNTTKGLPTVGPRDFIRATLKSGDVMQTRCATFQLAGVGDRIGAVA